MWNDGFLDLDALTNKSILCYRQELNRTIDRVNGVGSHEMEKDNAWERRGNNGILRSSRTPCGSYIAASLTRTK